MPRILTRPGYLPVGRLQRKDRLSTRKAVEHRPTRRWSPQIQSDRRPFTRSEWKISRNTVSMRKFGRKYSSSDKRTNAAEGNRTFLKSQEESCSRCTTSVL